MNFISDRKFFGIFHLTHSLNYFSLKILNRFGRKLNWQLKMVEFIWCIMVNNIFDMEAMMTRDIGDAVQLSNMSVKLALQQESERVKK